MASPKTKSMPGHLPTPDELAQAFKKRKLSADPSIMLTLTPGMLYPSLPTPVENSAPISHSVPQNAVPVLKAPYNVSDFFSDINSSLDEHTKKQFEDSTLLYPPPRAPMIPSAQISAVSGIMVPFVYPPLPSIRYDPLMNFPSDTESSDMAVSADQSSSSSPLTADTSVYYPAMAPLPFPPSNYMQYPLMADKAPPTPKEVFSSWLSASEHLPRVDMVVASAAGSIYDMRSSAEAAGLDITKLDEIVRLGHFAQSDPEASDRSLSEDSDSSDSPLKDYMSYYEKVDRSNHYDRFREKSPDNFLVVDSDVRNSYMHFQSNTSKDGKVLPTKSSTSIQSDDDIEAASDLHPVTYEPQLDSEKDIVNALGAHKEKRRANFLRIYNGLEQFARDHRHEIYLSRKQQLLSRLHSLESSEVCFDNTKDNIKDEELQMYALRRQAENDEQLLRLKFSYNYEKLKNVLNFYQTSNRSYKTMNSVMINKLQKLKNFFEFQLQLLTSGTESKAWGESDITSVRNRDSAKLYNGLVEQDYSNEIKEEFRAAIARDEGLTFAKDSSDFDPSLFRKVYLDRQHAAVVHDFMPLVTREEFRLVTGEAPSKLGPSKEMNSKQKSARHQIFQSPLYDRVTSGSDTNASDSGIPVKRRPGRRAAPKPTYGEEVAKHSNEAALVAKIMKQFVGPAAANAQELTNDMDLIGIETRWPVK